ncbi:MAG: SIMPL domain-containing protein [Phycisphaerales bacterium]|nr:SIMPL domain-containing protein [Phycisphaerales bacterium]
MNKSTMILALSAVVASSAPAQEAPLYDDRPKIIANGEAVVQVRPDKIIVSLGIETWDKDIMVAKQKNNDIISKARAAIKDCGVAAKDIQTDYLSIEPRYKEDYEKRDFLGHFVRNTLVITLTDAANLEELVTRSLEAGVNYIHGIEFQTTEFKKYREEAREMALKAAKEKADKMAAVLGQTVGAAIQITEGYGGSWWYRSSWRGWNYGRYEGMSQNARQNVPAGSVDDSETIALGKISIQANVSVTFELNR